MSASSPSPWPRLLRIPNLLTLPGDILAGALLSASADWPLLLPALAVSVCLYSAGLLYNDLADAAVDARERPDRPIPSGAVTPAAVRRAATLLLLPGLLLAIPARALPTAAFLALAILFYDFAAKKSALFGPVVMGLCRSLDLLLGAGSAALSPAPLAAAALLGLYIAAVTALARREADPASRITPARIGLLLRLLLPLQTLLCLASFLLPRPPPALPALPLALLPLALFPLNRALSRRFPPS
jgi:4-hydroxybenzoate polyprenyltransferase